MSFIIVRGYCPDTLCMYSETCVCFCNCPVLVFADDLQRPVVPAVPEDRLPSAAVHLSPL